MGRKYYVVWRGRTPGVFSTWDAAKESIFGFHDAHYKAFPSEFEAIEAFKNQPKRAFTKSPATQYKKPILESIAVDAACSGNPGKMEYKGVFTHNKQILFHLGPFEEGTNNIGEFLALVHGLAYLKQRNNAMPLYTDSITAMSWVRKKKANSKLVRTPQNSELFNLVQRAEYWLETNNYTTQILKWETELWGEIPADFGRK